MAWVNEMPLVERLNKVDLNQFNEGCLKADA